MHRPRPPAGADSGGAESLWSATFGPALDQFESGLGEDLDVDVAIVGSGYTGLWTALSLAKANPDLSIVVLEREQIGFGASGRNGGWCSALLPIERSDIAKRHGRDAVIAWQREMFATVDVVGAFATGTQLDPEFHSRRGSPVRPRGRRRDVLPIYSLTIGSEPLGDDVWERIGLGNRQTFTSASHLVIYGQRTADGRVAFGGRGAPYHFGSRIDGRFDTDTDVRRALRETVVSMFPALEGVEFPYHRGGHRSRRWEPSPGVCVDENRGFARFSSTQTKFRCRFGAEATPRRGDESRSCPQDCQRSTRRHWMPTTR